jgi:hypothetical protein
LGLPTLLLPSGLHIYSFLMTLSSDIFSTWPNHLSGSLYNIPTTYFIGSINSYKVRHWKIKVRIEL